MRAVEEVFVPALPAFELRPFQDRVLELVRLFEAAPTVRLRVIGTITAGEPIEAVEGPGEVVEIHGPERVLQRHRHLLPALRCALCPYLQSISSDVFEIARVITPILVGLKLSGKAPIPLDPWLFAGIALMIARMGVAGFCKELSGAGTDASADDAPAEPVHAARHRSRHHKGKSRRTNK